MAVVVLLLISAGFLGVSLFGQQGSPTAPVAAVPQLASPSRMSGRTVSTRAAKVSAVVARSVPVALRIPAIGVDVSLSTLGLNADRTVQVPTKYQEPGWFKLGPTPGQLGSAVILGHVDDKKGPAVFFKLRSLRAGDTVDVSLADGMVAHFVVKAVETYKKAQFPSQRVYGSRGYSALQLVTCGGEFDTTTGHYLSNVVAYTSLVAATPAGQK